MSTRLRSLVLGSVITAAFVGPGTVTTCARAGASFGTALLWALLFSTLACALLQEACLRLRHSSGFSLGEAMRRQLDGSPWAWPLMLLVLGAIVLGCAAYEAGNILGGVAGAELVLGVGRRTLTLILAVAAAALLWRDDPNILAKVLSALVGVMGLVFVLTAAVLAPDLGQLLGGLIQPSIPTGASLLVIGLVGTTVVPYNLFLGSGLPKEGTLEGARLGLLIAIVLGGMVSMAILVVGTAVAEPFSFAALAEVLAQRLGAWARAFFGIGLLAAGFTSAVTAPLAADLTVRSLFPSLGRSGSSDLNHAGVARRARWIRLSVLTVGVVFGLAGASPIPAIILAQALNGLLLPLVALFLLTVVNDRKLMGAAALNGWVSNLGMVLAVAVSVLLGLLGVWRALARVSPVEPPRVTTVLVVAVFLLMLLAWPLARQLARLRKKT